MEQIMKIAAVAILASAFSILVGQREKIMALLLSLAACLVILVLGIRFLEPVRSVLEQLEDLSGLSAVVTAPLMKVTGIGLLTQIACGVCADAGENALAKIVEVSGSILALSASMPLLASVLSLMEQLLGGMG